MFIFETCNVIEIRKLESVFQLGGIVKPNDGRCHLDEEGVYTHSSLQDYPSISQVNFKVSFIL